jgi:hypothetical protein
LWQVSVQARGIDALSQRDRNDSLREAMVAVGLRHRRRNLPKHFTKLAYQLYRYAPRAGDPGNTRKSFRGSYQGRKLRLFGHTLPLVFTGELRKLTLYGLRTVNATASRGEATVKIRLPNKANFKNPNSKVHPLKELQAVNGAELVDLERFAGEELERQWRRRGAAGSAGVNIMGGLPATGAAAG